LRLFTFQFHSTSFHFLTLVCAIDASSHVFADRLFSLKYSSILSKMSSSESESDVENPQDNDGEVSLDSIWYFPLHKSLE